MKKAKRALVVGLMAAGLVVAGSAIGPAAAATPGASASDHHEFKGPIVSINRSANTFKVNDQRKGVVQIKVNKSTRYEHLKGFSALKKGLKVDVEARRSGNQWIAVHVERKS